MGDNITVMLVDDSVPVRAALRDALSDHGGFEVVGEAGDGAAALELLSQLQPDVIVLDLAMPGLDGLETLPRIKDVSPATKICVLSLAGRSMQAEAMERGAHLYFSKAEPLEVVAKALAGI
jgi:DNA-binding NarL/FixJ family response regulator